MCPLYQNERYCLFRNLRETNKNIETLLFGNDENSINENYNISVFSLILDLKHDIFGLFLTFRSKLFHNETVDGIKDVKDILSLLLGVV
jgi:hypothetical protein